MFYIRLGFAPGCGREIETGDFCRYCRSFLPEPYEYKKPAKSRKDLDGKAAAAGEKEEEIQI